MRLLKLIAYFGIVALAGCATRLTTEDRLVRAIGTMTDAQLCQATQDYEEATGFLRESLASERTRRGLTCHNVSAEADAAASTLSVGSDQSAVVRATGSVNMRAGPGTRHAVLGTLRPGDEVTVLSVQGTWCECMAGARKVFISCRLLTAPAGGWASIGGAGGRRDSATGRSLSPWAPAARAAGVWPRSSGRSFGPPGTTFGPDIVIPEANGTDHAECQSTDDTWGCMLTNMRQRGASRAALSFARHLEALDNPGWAVDFREFGKVDLVGTSYPLRANTNGAYLMVNGTPNIVEAESFEISATDRRLPAWRSLMRRHPDAFLTVRPGFIRHERTRSGGQRFIFADVVAICRACEPLADAIFAFDFAPDGRLAGSRLLQVLAPGASVALSNTNQPADSTPAEVTVPSVDMWTLSDQNARSIWTTSVYSYAPGGGGPGGGLADDKLRVGGYGDQYRSLIWFRLRGSRIARSATLILHVKGDDNTSTSTPIILEAISQDWNWRLGDRLWWANRPSGSALVQLASPGGRGTRYQIDITELYNSWVNGVRPNYGLMLTPVLTNNNYSTFFSTRAEVSLRPQVRIEY